MRLVVPIGLIQVGQLQDELLAAFPSWRGTLQADGRYADPLLRVEWTTTELRLTFPDGTDTASVQAVITSHVPLPPKNWGAIQASARGKLIALGLTADEATVLVRS